MAEATAAGFRQPTVLPEGAETLAGHPPRVTYGPDSRDAVEVLDRAERGERFACVEYSVVLSRALNAVGIPARRVDLRMSDQHVGSGRGHVVCEAWVDDLGRWVLLDGQNGASWGAPDEAHGLRDLQARYAAGEARPALQATARTVSAEAQEHWWAYVASATTSRLGWGEQVVPLFQGEPFAQRLVVGPRAVTHPDLSELETGTVDGGAAPLLTFRPVHPFAAGVEVDGHDVSAGLDLGSPASGQHDRAVRTRTDFGLLAGQPLRVVVRT